MKKHQCLFGRVLITIVGMMLWELAATSVFAFNFGDRVQSTTDGLSIHSSDYLSSSVIDHANTGNKGTVQGGPYYDSASGFTFYYVAWDTHSAGYSVQNYLQLFTQPNLTPYQPSGWSDKIVVSRIANSTTDSTSLTTVDTLYVNWAVVNNGTAATSANFNNELYVDGVATANWVTEAPLNVNSYSSLTTGYSIGQLSAGTHTITVAADYGGVIAESNEGDNSYTKTITVSTANLPAPTLSSPTNGSTGQSTTPTFSWSAVAGADSGYRIMVTTSAADLPTDPTADTGGASLIINATPATTSYTPSTPLNAGTTYYWEVHGRSNAQFGTWSSVSSFTTSPLAGGTWTALASQPGDSIGICMLLSDGTVLAEGSGANWYQLTPASSGHYFNGTWSALNSSSWGHQDGSTAVLTNGNVYVGGGENSIGNGGIDKVEIYNPVTGLWSVAVNPTYFGNISDGNAMLLPNGQVLIEPQNSSGLTFLFNPGNNTFAQTIGAPLDGIEESTWVKLPNDNVLAIDSGNSSAGATTAEMYSPSSGTWQNAVTGGTVPNIWPNMTGTGDVSEMGPAFLLPNGNAIFFGGNGVTAVYNNGTWSQSASLPVSGLGMKDAPGAMMANGKVLLAVSPMGDNSSQDDANGTGPTSFYEYDYTANSGAGGYALAPSPGSGIVNRAQQLKFLDLPDGTVLLSTGGSQLFIYQPDGSPLPSGKPTISVITQNPDGSYHLIGTGLNGISEGACYGDDEQMASDYPLVRVTDGNGNVYYERTYNWSRTSVMTGNASMTTEFANSAGLPPGNYSLVVVANGISSDPYSFTVPSPKSNQTISFAPLENKTYGEPPFGVSATASSGLSVGFSILSGPATSSGNNVTLTGSGTVTVRASQSGNSSYNAAPNVDQPFTVYAPPQAGVTISGNKFIISWPTNVAGFVLQSTPSLNPDSWSTVSPSPVIVNGQFTVTNNVTSGNMFYRLQK
jgi:hypothetical protein